jgi:hypothetical protein
MPLMPPILKMLLSLGIIAAAASMLFLCLMMLTSHMSCASDSIKELAVMPAPALVFSVDDFELDKNVMNKSHTNAKPLEENSSSIVPASLHFIHLSNGLLEIQSEIPSTVRDNVEEWKMLHLQWRATLWNNILVQQAFPENIVVGCQSPPLSHH